MDPEEAELQNDYRYRNYAAVIEKALRNFESSSEWADLISSLGKLIKVCSDAVSGPSGINAQTTAFAIWCLHCKRPETSRGAKLSRQAFLLFSLGPAE